MNHRTTTILRLPLLTVLIATVPAVCVRGQTTSGAGTEPVSLTTLDLFQLAQAAGETPAASSPLGVMGVIGPTTQPSEAPDPTAAKAIEESRDRCRRAGLLSPDGKLSEPGQSFWKAMATPELSVQARRFSREGLGIVWYGLGPEQVWGILPQKDGGLRIVGPFPRADVHTLLAERLALPSSDQATNWNQTFSLFDWMVLLCVERERIVALSPDAGGSDRVGISAAQVASSLLTPHALASLGADPSLDPAEALDQPSDADAIARALDSLTEQGWLERSGAEGSFRYRISSRGADLARQVLYPRQSLLIAAVAPAADGHVNAATAQFCVAAEGRTLVRYLPASHQFAIASIPAGDAKALQSQTIASVLKEALASASKQTSARLTPPRVASSQPSGPPLGQTIREELLRGTFRIDSPLRTREVWGRGKVDLWAVSTRGDKQQADVEYEDTTGSGTPDVVRVRDYPDGPFTRSFINRDGKWEESNILDAFLEISFALPWSRDAYHKHNVNVILNDRVIAQLTDVIPEGLYRFPVRPQDLRVDANTASANDVRVETSHLRGGHYVVSSNFNLVIRLSRISRHVVADDAEQAEKILRTSAQLRASGVDLAVYANGWRAVPPAPKPDEAVKISGEVYNLGMDTAQGWKVQFHDGDPTKGGKLIEERSLAALEPGDAVTAEGSWKAAPGEHRIFVTLVVPEGAKDLRDTNNQTSVLVMGGGDSAPPELLVAEPPEGAALTNGKIAFRGTVSDNVSVAGLEYNLDGGLWVAITPQARWEAAVEMPKGDHKVRFRARDTSGLTCQQERSVCAQ